MVLMHGGSLNSLVALAPKVCVYNYGGGSNAPQPPTTPFPTAMCRSGVVDSHSALWLTPQYDSDRSWQHLDVKRT
jgi:hypothetical protein